MNEYQQNSLRNQSIAKLRLNRISQLSAPLIPTVHWIAFSSDVGSADLTRRQTKIDFN